MALITERILTNNKISPYKQLDYYYNSGSEYEDKTGGWTSEGYTWDSGYTTIEPVKYSDYVAMIIPLASYRACIFGTTNLISFVGKNKVKVEIEVLQVTRYIGIAIKASKSNVEVSALAKYRSGAGELTVGNHVLELSVGSINVDAYLTVYGTGGGRAEGGSFKIKSIYFE